MVSLNTPGCNTNKASPGRSVHWLAQVHEPSCCAAPGIGPDSPDSDHEQSADFETHASIGTATKRGLSGLAVARMCRLMP